MKIKSLVFGDFLDFSDKNSSNIVNNQLTGLVLLCKVFETSSQISRCLLVLPYQWAVRNKQNKFCGSLVFPYCTYSVSLQWVVQHVKKCKALLEFNNHPHLARKLYWQGRRNSCKNIVCGQGYGHLAWKHFGSKPWMEKSL